jgi:hypothetical protein
MKTGSIIVLILCLAVLAGGAYMWVTEPPRARQDPVRIATPEAAPDREAERGLCALVARPQGLAPEIVRAAAASGRLHYTLAALLQQYADTPTPGAAQQVIRECKRLELP